MSDMDHVNKECLVFINSDNRDYGSINSMTKIIDGNVLFPLSRGCEKVKISLVEFVTNLYINNITQFNCEFSIRFLDSTLTPPYDVTTKYKLASDVYTIDTLINELNNTTIDLGPANNLDLTWSFDELTRKVKFFMDGGNSNQEYIINTDVGNSISNIIGVQIPKTFGYKDTIIGDEPVNLSITTSILIGLNSVRSNILCYPSYGPNGKLITLNTPRKCDILARIPIANLPIYGTIDFNSIYSNHTFNIILDTEFLESEVTITLMDDNFRPLQLNSEYFTTLKYEFY